jgi:hypothetical protein
MMPAAYGILHHSSFMDRWEVADVIIGKITVGRRMTFSLISNMVNAWIKWMGDMHVEDYR